MPRFNSPENYLKNRQLRPVLKILPRKPLTVLWGDFAKVAYPYRCQLTRGAFMTRRYLLATIILGTMVCLPQSCITGDGSVDSQRTNQRVMAPTTGEAKLNVGATQAPKSECTGIALPDNQL